MRRPGPWWWVVIVVVGSTGGAQASAGIAHGRPVQAGNCGARPTRVASAAPKAPRGKGGPVGTCFDGGKGPAPLPKFLASASDDEPEGNPWVDGPEVPAPDEDELGQDAAEEQKARPPSDTGEGEAAPPREPGAEPDPLQLPPDLPEPLAPYFDPGLLPPTDDIRLTTTLEREDVFRWGDLNLAHALAFLPGLWWPYLQSGSPLPSARGLPSEHLGVRIDGVPVLPMTVFPEFPLLAHVPFDEVQKVELRHGPRSGLGLEGASAGVLDVTTLPRAREMGEAGAITGRVRMGYGGPDLEKAIYLRGETGYRRARISLGAGGVHRERQRLGRGLGLYPSSFGVGGYLVGRADIAPAPGIRTWASWQASRQVRTPVPSQCNEDDRGRFTLCVLAQDRARDTLASGIDTRHTLFDLVVVSSRSRFHVQRFSEDWLREGNQSPSRDRTVTELWRGGALTEETVTTKPFRAWILDFRPEVSVGVEAMRDRVTSGRSSMSQFGFDLSTGGFEEPNRMPIASGGQRTVVRGHIRAGVYGRLLSLQAVGNIANTRVAIIRPDLSRMEGRLVGHSAITFEGEVTARAHVGKLASVFGSVVRTDRPDTLWELSRGPVRFENEPPLPALPGTARYYQHALEFGGDLDLDWLEVAGVFWVADRSGPLTVGPYAPEVLTRPDVVRTVREGRRQAGGVEGRARWQTPFDGLSAEGTFAAVAIDDSVFFREENPFAPMPVAGVPRPTGAAAVNWAPSDWPFDVYARLRYALPQARLHPDEELDEALCPQGLVDPQLEPCQGIFGYALYDVGMAFSPVQNLRIEGIATNLMDAPTTLRISDWPGGGLSARATATLQF